MCFWHFGPFKTISRYVKLFEDMWPACELHETEYVWIIRKKKSLVVFSKWLPLWLIAWNATTALSAVATCGSWEESDRTPTDRSAMEELLCQMAAGLPGTFTAVSFVMSYHVIWSQLVFDSANYHDKHHFTVNWFIVIHTQYISMLFPLFVPEVHHILVQLIKYLRNLGISFRLRHSEVLRSMRWYEMIDSFLCSWAVFLFAQSAACTGTCRWRQGHTGGVLKFSHIVPFSCWNVMTCLGWLRAVHSSSHAQCETGTWGETDWSHRRGDIASSSSSTVVANQHYSRCLTHLWYPRYLARLLSSCCLCARSRLPDLLTLPWRRTFGC